MPRHEYMSKYERHAREDENREDERKLDRTRFVWFCVGTAFAVLMEIIIELALKRTGS